MVFNSLLDLRFQLRSDVTASNLLKKGSLGRRKVSTEICFPFCDLVYRDGVKLEKRLGAYHQDAG